VDGEAPARAGAPEGYALAYEEAKRALEEQERVVAELRSRAGVLIGAAAITTSFFGGRMLGRHVHALSWIAIACFALLGVTVLIVLWPWRDWRFTINAQAFIQTYLEPPDGEPLELSVIHRDLALHMSASWDANRRQLRWLLRAFRLTAVLLIGEVVFWIIALISEA